MDEQPRHNPQAMNPFFADGRAMRPPPAGTVAWGRTGESTVEFTGLEPDGAFAARNPLFHEADREGRIALMRRGRERYDIHCAVCHDRAGTGRGIAMPGGPARFQGFPPPPSLHEDRIRAMPDGELFVLISDGARNMPPYRRQITPPDRWAIVAYLRALQRSQRATLADVPAHRRAELDRGR